VVGSVRHVASAEFLTLDRLVKMGVTTASVATELAGLHMEVHSGRDSFERVLAARLGAAA
jgi:hypothetical protein